MQFDNYIICLDKTVASTSDKVKSWLVKMFVEAGIATKNNDFSSQLCLENTNKIDISDRSLIDQLTLCMRQSESACRIYEKWEFEKDYKYSVLFTCENFNSILEKVLKINPLLEACENEYIYKDFIAPVSYHTEKYSFLKFNLIFAALHPLTQEEFLLKYPFIVVFHKEEEVIEFRFDVIKRVFISGKRESTIYADLISEMRKYIKTQYDCDLYPLDLEPMVNVSKNDPEVKLIAQYMKLPNGGNAQLDVGKNQEYVLPFIGELKSLLSDYKTDLEKVPTFNDALEQFMFEMEEMSDYPWIELLWENEIKTRSIHVKFVFNYMKNEYCLIQHYYSNYLIGMERMNYVVKYIVDHRNDDKKQTE